MACSRDDANTQDVAIMCLSEDLHVLQTSEVSSQNEPGEHDRMCSVMEFLCNTLESEQIVQLDLKQLT